MKKYLFSRVSFFNHIPVKSYFLSLMFMLVGVLGFGQTSVTLTSGTSWTVPANVYNVTVECWGGGGAGGSGVSQSSGGARGSAGGGAGGAYAKKNTISVTPGSAIAYSIGLGGANSASATTLGASYPGGDTWFSTNTTVLAKGGAGAPNIGTTTTLTNGAGGAGTVTGSIGDQIYAGGNGGTGQANASGNNASGGGGSSAGTGANGNSGGNGSGTTAGSGGAAPTGGYAGAAGVSGTGASGTNAASTNYGAAGSGAVITTSTTARTGGAGAGGRIIITYTTVTGYSVVYNGNGSTGGSVPTDATLYTTGSTVTVKTNSGSLVRTGYTFSGWNTAADGTGTDYAASGSATFTISANTTLYAKWVVSSTPFIATSGTLSALSTTYGTASSNTSFSVSAGNLTSSLIVTPPSGFEVSLSASSGFSTSLDLGSTDRTNTTIYIRLAATTAVGTYSGNVNLASGSTTANVSTAASTVNKQTLTITGITGANKVYDGSATATVTGTAVLSGVIGTDDVSLSGTPAFVFANANVATGKGITVTGYTLSGTKTGNYTLTQPTTLTANITAKSLVITAPAIASKVYNGSSATGTITLGTLSGFVGAETVTATASGTYPDANVGTGKIATIVYTLANGTNGGLAANYSLADGSTTGDITPAAPTFTTSTININTGNAYALPGANVSSNSAGAFTYVLGTASPAGSVTLTGTTINGVASGTATLTVNQAASGNYSAGSTTVTVNVTTVSATTDYFRSNVATGTWATAGSWQSSSDNSNWITATASPTSAANTITIRNGHTITIDSSVTLDQVVVENGGVLETTSSFTINDGTGDDIIIQSGGTLDYSSTSRPTFNGNSTVSAESNGRILLSAGSAGTLVESEYVYKNASILEWAQTSAFTASGATYFPNVDDNTVPIFRISNTIGSNVGGGTSTVINGILEVTGSVTFAGNSSKTFRNGIRGSGTVAQTTAYKFIINGTTAELGGGTLTLNSASGGGVTISSGTVVTMTSDKTINAGNVTNGGTINFGAYVIGGTGSFTQSAGATIITSNAAGVSGSVGVSGAKTFSAAGANYTFNSATSTPFIAGGSTSFSTLNVNAEVTNNLSSTSTTVTTALNVNNGGTFIASNTLNLSNTNGALNVAVGGTYDNGGENSITSSGGTPTINIDGTFITRDAQGFTNAGSATGTAIPGITPTLGNSSVIVYGLNGDQEVTNFAYRNLTFSNGGTKTTRGAISAITGNVTINSGVTVDAGTRTFGGAGTNLIMLGASVFKTGGSSTTPDATGTYTLANTSTIEFGGSSNTNIRANPIYGNINITGSNVNLSGIGTSITLQSGSAFTVKNGGTFNVKNTDGLSGGTTTAINNINSPSIVLETGSTVDYDGAAQTVTNSPNYSNLSISAAGVKTASGALTVGQNLNLNVGILILKDSSANDLTIGGVMTIASGTIFDNNGENQILGSGSIVNNGTFITRDAQGFSGLDATIPAITTITMGAGSTIHYALVGNQNVSARSDYQNLIFTGNGTKTVLGSTTPIAGTVTINGTGTILDAADNTFGSASTNLTMTAGAFHLGGLGVKPDIGGTYSLASGTTLEFTGASATQIFTTPQYANVIVSGTNVVAGSTSAEGLSFQPSGSFTVKNGATFNVNNPDGFSGSSTTAIKNTNTPTITLEAGSTIDYTGMDQAVTHTVNYPNLKISAAGVKSSTGTLVVDNLTTISAGTLKVIKTTDALDANVMYAHKGINNTGGTVIFENNAQLIQDVDAVNFGNIQSQRDVVDMNNVTGQIDYVYWSSPVSGQQIKGFSPNTPATGYLQYTESNDKFVVTSDVNFLEAKGYAIRAETGTNGYAKTYSFTGVPNNGNKQFQNLKYTNSTHGYNLVGNPYPSNIDFDLLFALNSTKIYSTAFFWTNNSYTAAQVGSTYSGNNYAVFNGTGGSPATYNPTNPYNGSVAPNGKIKVGQAFIVQAKSAGLNAPLDFNNSIRVTDKGSFFQKANTKNRFWLEMISPNNLVNTILVGYIPGATNNYETDFDGELFVVGSDSFYSVLGAKKLAIQGKADSFSADDVVALGNVYSATGNYTIKLKNPEGIFGSSQTIYLRDKLLNKYINLNDVESYSFAGTKGTDNTRFEIVYKDSTVLGNTEIGKPDFVVYRDGDNFVITSSKTLGRVEFYDTSGRMVVSKKTIDKMLKVNISSLVDGVYIIKAENSGDVKNKKILK